MAQVIDAILRLQDQFTVTLGRATAGMKDAAVQAQRTGKQMQSIGNGLSSVGSTLTKAVTIPVVGAAALAAKGIYNMANSASDLVEAQNVVQNTFKTSYKSVEAWSNTVMNSAGINKTAATQYVGFMGAMLKSSGVSESASASMSKNLVQLTGDLSSFYNISTSDMWQKIQSGMAGQTKPLRDIGINMTEANLQAFALSEGITTSYKKMSQGDQTALRYAYLMHATADAQKDFARTSNISMANQSRILQGNIGAMKESIGEEFRPAILDMYKVINPFIEQEIPKLQQGFKALSTAVTSHSGQIKKFLSVVDSIITKFSKLKTSQIDTAGKFAFLAAASGPSLSMLGKFSSVLGVMQSKFGKNALDFTKLFKGGTKASKDLGGIFGPLKRMGRGFVDIEKSSGKIGAAFGKLGAVKAFGGMVQKSLSPATKAIGGLKDGITTAAIKGLYAADKLPEGLKSAASKMSSEAPKIGKVFGLLGKGASSGLGSIAKTAMNMFAPAVLVGAVIVGLGAMNQHMGGQLVTMINNMAAKAPEMIQKFSAGLLAKLPMLMDSGVKVLMALINAITKNAPYIISAAVKILASLVQGLAANLPKLIPAALSCIVTIAKALIQNLPLILQSGLKLLVALVQGITSNPQQLVNTIVSLVTSIVTVLIQNLPLIITAAIQIIIAIAKGLILAIPQLIADLPQIFNAIIKAFESVDWASVGMSIIQSIWGGIQSIGKNLGSMIKGLFTGKSVNVSTGVNVAHNANGTSFFGGGPSLVGENGPELLNLPRGSSVVNNQRTNSLLKNQRQITIAKLADQIIVREEADIDKITTMLAQKLMDGAVNMA